MVTKDTPLEDDSNFLDELAWKLITNSGVYLAKLSTDAPTAASPAAALGSSVERLVLCAQKAAELMEIERKEASDGK